MVTPIVDPCDAGFTTTGQRNFAARIAVARETFSPRFTTVPAGTGMRAEAKRVFVVTLCMPIALAWIPDPV